MCATVRQAAGDDEQSPGTRGFSARPAENVGAATELEIRKWTRDVKRIESDRRLLSDSSALICNRGPEREIGRK